MSTEIKVFANTVPAICLVLGFILVFSGITGNNNVLTSAGWTFVIVGVIMQVLYLFKKRLGG